MARLLRQATAVDVPIGPFISSTDAVTPSTALTITQTDVRLKKGAGNWAAKDSTAAATHEEFGYYEVTLNSTDTGTLGPLRLAVTESGAGSVWEDFSVVPANLYDSMYSTSLIHVDVKRINTTTIQGDGTSTNTWRPV